MNPPRTTPDLADAHALEQRFAMHVVAHLHDGSERIAGDVSARLRFARDQALLRAVARFGVVASTAQAPVVLGSSLALGGDQRGEDTGVWVKLASIIPLLLLIAGLLLIERQFENEQISAAAEIDAALLADDLPPDAYNDPGFAEFLKIPRD
jgi:hypothetical protein